MYGNSAGPPPSRGASTVITLRVLYAAAGFLTCGLLACVPLFRVAVLRGRWYDWTAAWVSLPLSIACLAVVGSLPETDHRTDVAMAGLLLIGAAAAAYFLVTDIRVHAAPRPFAGHQPPHAPVAGPYYGPAHPVPPHPVAPYAPAAPVAPVAPPPQHPPAPARIDQVRAELDELSDYLRHHDGGHQQGGR
ncbi:Integral membrane protein OS=Streptomyces tendae OX=1932 GN=F3L20_28775 PE=4 SV=1 [Streptomyces tendae]